jgi:hypothetical protein
MAELTHQKLSRFGNVEVRVMRFEDEGMERGAFGLVATAQAYHWLDPETRIRRFADALYAHGTAAVVANVQVTPEHNLPFWVRVQDVYRAEAPDLAHKGEFRKPDDLPPHPFEGSDLFEDLEQCGHAWHWTLPTERYIALLQTHSPHAALDEDVRARLVAGIAELIDAEFGGEVTEYYVALAGLARKR